MNGYTHTCEAYVNYEGCDYCRQLTKEYEERSGLTFTSYPEYKEHEAAIQGKTIRVQTGDSYMFVRPEDIRDITKEVRKHADG